MMQTQAYSFFIVLLAFTLCALIIEAQVPDSQKQALLSMASRWSVAPVLSKTCDPTLSKMPLVTGSCGSASYRCWTSASDPCMGKWWYGVFCNDANTTVISLSLTSDFCTLVGPLSTSDQLTNFPSLSSLELRLSLTGTLPPSWSSLSQLTMLTLYNNMSGTLPSQWSGLINLTKLSISSEDNNPVGTVPPQWSTLTKLNHLDLSSNALTGQLPDAFSTLTSLTWLQVSSNKFVGTLPASWSSMTNMSYFTSFLNSIGGTIPSQWSTWTQAQGIDLTFNSFTGTLPASWASMTKLSNMVMYYNPGITGSIPPAWWTIGFNSSCNSAADRIRPCTMIDLARTRLTNMTIPSTFNPDYTQVYVSFAPYSPPPLPPSPPPPKGFITARANDHLTGALVCAMFTSLIAAFAN